MKCLCPAIVMLAIGLARESAHAVTILAQTDFGTVEGFDVSPFVTQYPPFSGPTSPEHFGVATSGGGHSWSSFDWGGQDHTNPGTGSFMVVDGSSNANLSVLSYAANVVAGAEYTWSGWVQIVQALDGPDVELSFRVDGVQMGVFPFDGTAYDNIEWVWRPFTFSYTAPASGPTVFALHDNNTSGAMNDFGLDDLVLSTTAQPPGATAYFSFTGSFTDGSETQSFLFNTERAFPPRSVPFSLRTWHAEGGQNAAGQWITRDGFDPFLRLYNDTPAPIAANDNYPPGLDSLIDGNTPGMPESLPADSYIVDLATNDGTLGAGDGHWAVDLVGPADVMTLTGASDDGPLGSTIASLAIGTDNADRTPAELSLGPFQTLSVDDALYIGNTGNAAVAVAGGLLAGGYVVLGFAPDSTGQLMVSGSGSSLTANERLYVGESGAGSMRIEDQGKVISSHDAFYSDSVGGWIGSRGTVEVDGKDSLWQSDALSVGYEGQGMVTITGGGKIDTLGNAYIGRHADHVDSSVSLSGAAPDGTPSSWHVSGDLHIAGSDTGPVAINQSRLTINSGALAEVDGTTIYHNGGNGLELHGGTLRTAALVGAGLFDWTSGTLDLTNSGLMLDSVTPDSVFGHDLTVGAGKSLKLSYATLVLWRDLFVGFGGAGALTVQDGGTLTTGFGVPTIIAHGLGSTGTVTVTGMDSVWNVKGPLEVGSGGHGSLNITAGGNVIHLSGWHTDVARDVGVGRVLVDGDDSLWDASSLTVGAFGDGYLTVSGGGHVVSDASILAWEVGSTADVLVTGTDSKWDVSDYLHIGGSEYGAGGIAALRVEDDAEVAVGDTLKVWGAGNVSLAGGAASSQLSADAIVLEPGASFTWTGNVVVRANHLTGFGDDIELPNFYLGHAGGVSGAGSHSVGPGQSLEVVGFFLVGADAPATLDVSGGGTVKSWGAVIAAEDGSGGSRARVSGAGSTWNIQAYALVVGQYWPGAGAAALSVDNEAAVTADNIHVWPPGTITLDGGAIASTRTDIPFWLIGGALEGRGTVNVADSLLNGGVVSPGLSTGLLNIVGDYVQQTTGTLAIELGGTNSSLFDRLRIVDGSATLGGTLQVSLMPGYTPAANDSFEILTATGGVVPAFTNYLWPTLVDGLTWGLSYNPTSVVLSVLVAGLPGDYNGDGSVDAADYVVWRKGLGTIYTPADYDTWRTNFGRTAGSGEVTAGYSTRADAAIPEPAAVFLVGIGIVATLLTRGRFVEGKLLSGRRSASALKRERLLIAIISLGTFLPVSATAGFAAPIADVAADFSPTNNPNGAWSYGWSASLTSTLNVYPNDFHAANGIDGWQDNGHISWGAPNVAHNGTGDVVHTDPQVVTWQPYQFSLHPGQGGEFSHAAWTSPVEGKLDVVGTFTGIDHTGTTSDVHVLLNASAVFDGYISGYGNTSSFLTTVTLEIGDRIDFAVGYGANGNFWDDSTALMATIVPSLSGDYNRNGVVGAADYVVWRETYRGPNVPAPSLAADGDGDGDVDNNDSNVWRAYFGQVAPPIIPGMGSILAAPEPGGRLTLMVALGAAAIVHRSCRGLFKLLFVILAVGVAALSSSVGQAALIGHGYSGWNFVDGVIDFSTATYVADREDPNLDYWNGSPWHIWRPITGVSSNYGVEWNG